MVVDPRLEGSYDITQLKTLAFAASLCIRASSIWRPTMSEVKHFTLFFPFCLTYDVLPYIYIYI